jgi:hypothetical protein
MYVREYVMEHARQRAKQGNRARREELAERLPRIPVSQIGHCPGAESAKRAMAGPKLHSRERPASYPGTSRSKGSVA